MTLLETIAVFKKWLYMPDEDPLLALFGAIVANRRPGDPVWLLMVAGSSRGKSEMLSSGGKLLDVFPASTITEASLLSGTSKRDKAKDAKGGLLREIGPYGILLCKDFGSILNMSRDPRAAVLAALREVYDGAWTRHVGTDGGQTLRWEGKVGFLGGCTPNVDRHHGVMSSMGERFVFVRMPDQDDAALAERALEHAGKERTMRHELSEAVVALLDSLTGEGEAPPIADHERARLIALTTLAVKCRSTIERDSYSREIELVPGAESPGRLTRVAANLLAAFHILGLDRAGAWRVVQRVILDSVPMLRKKVLDILAAHPDAMTTADVAEECGYPTITARRQLEELAAYGVADREGQGRGKADNWTLTPWTRGKLTAIVTVSEMSGAVYSDHANGNGSAPLTTPTRVLTDKTEKVPLPLSLGLEAGLDL